MRSCKTSTILTIIFNIDINWFSQSRKNHRSTDITTINLSSRKKLIWLVIFFGFSCITFNIRIDRDWSISHATALPGEATTASRRGRLQFQIINPRFSFALSACMHLWWFLFSPEKKGHCFLTGHSMGHIQWQDILLN